MHVVQLLPALNSGGVERGTLEIAKALVDAGHRATVISAGGRLVPPLLDSGADHVHFALGQKSPRTLLRAPQLHRLLDHLSPDIVHVRSRLPAWILRLAFSYHRRPFKTVSTLHGLNSVSRYSAIMLRADAVIAVSETCANYWRKHYPGPRTANLRIIERGVDDAEFPFGYRPRAGFAETLPELETGAPIWCLPGRIVRGKGHLDLIPVLTQISDANVLIPGEGPASFVTELKNAARAAGVLERMHFLGHRQDIRDILATSDIVFSLSHKPESFGRTAAEALALGRPVIGYDHGGVGEILAKVYPEGGVRPMNVDHLIERVKTFHCDPPDVPRHSCYRLRAMCESTLTVYDELCRCRSTCQ